MPDHEPLKISALSRQELTELVFDNSADYVLIVTDLDGRIVAWNPTAETILGWTAEEAIGQPVDMFFTSEDIATGQPVKERMLAAREGRAIDERWHIKRNGSIFWSLGELTPLRKNGELIGYSKILRDRTRERLTEENLRLAQQVGHIGTFELFPTQGWIAVSSEFCKLWGLPAQEFVPVASLMEQIHPEDRGKLATGLAELPENALDYVEYRICRADTGEERWIARRGEPIHIETVRATRYLGVCYDITDQKHSETAIREAEARWRDLFDGMQEGFYLAEAIWDPQGQMASYRYLEANPGFWVQTGLDTSTPVIGQTVHDVLPEIPEHYIQVYATLLETGTPNHFEAFLPIQGGRWFDVRARRVSAERFAVLFMDITQRKQTEAALAESEARFKAITHSIEQIVWASQPDGYHDFFNERWYDYTGVEKGSTHGHKWLDRLHPEDRDHAWAIWQQSIKTGSPYRVEFRLRHHTGRYRWFLARAHPLRDNSHQIVRWFGSSTDIQEIVEAREVLALSQEQLERQVAERTRERDRIWRLSNDLMAITRLNGELVALNDACGHTLGLSEAELIGTSFLDLTHPEDLPKTYQAMARLSEGLDLTAFEMRLRHKNSSYRLTAWTAVPEDDYIYAIGRDITDQRQTEEQLRQAQKMEAVGQLTGGIAHDFNNLLTGIIGSLDLMQRRFESGRLQGLERYIGAATTSAQRAAALTQRLLAFSRRQTLNLRPVNVNQLVASLEDLLHRTIGENINLETKFGAGLCPAYMDENQLESALINLVINARDAMPAGGTITLATSSLEVSEVDGVSDELQAGSYILLSVTDTGTGMPPEVLTKAFDPFFTTKPIGQGTGLGLSMVYGYLKQAQGHIRIHSEVGKGTRVCLYLPCHTEEVEASVVGTEKAVPRGLGETVLVVEDEPVVRALIVEVLDELGYRAIEAADAKEALPVLESPQRIDLMISDVGLPGLNGRQLADLARQYRPTLKVLFATGYAEGSGARNYLANDMEIITKPFAIDALATKIREMLAVD